MARSHTHVYETGKRGYRVGAQSLRHWAFKNYWTAYAYMSLCNLPVRHQAPILIYQMGKVGSTTITRALKKTSTRQPIYKVHTLSQQSIHESMEQYRNLAKENRAFSWERAKHIFESQMITKQLAHPTPDRVWKIITLTRDPIARNLSSFFQTIDLYVPNFSKNLSDGCMEIDDLQKIFFTEYDHFTPLRWFDTEINNSFGIDIFSYKFDIEEGFSIYKNNNIELLVLKTESIESCIKHALREFLNVELNSIESRNIADQKLYNSIYKKFKDSIHFPDNYLDDMYQSKYVKHFYSDLEIQSFRNKWNRRDR